MKYLICSLFVVQTYVCFSQLNDSFQKATFNGSEDYFEKNLTYPIEMLRKMENGQVILSFRLNDEGTMDSVDLFSSSHEILVTDVVKTLLSTSNLWSSTYVNEQPTAHWYKLVVYFSIIGDLNSNSAMRTESEKNYNSAELFYNKGKYLKALKKLDAAIEIAPYHASYFELRHKINIALGNIEEANTDKTTQNYLYMDVMKVVNINAGYQLRSEASIRQY